MQKPTRRHEVLPLDERDAATPAPSISIDGYLAGIDRDPLEWIALGAKKLSTDWCSALERRGSREHDAGLIAAVALLRCVIEPGDESFALAARALRIALRSARIDAWAPELRMLAFQAAVLGRDDALVATLEPFAVKLPGVRWAARADAARKEWAELAGDAHGLRQGAITRWWRVINEPFIRDGLEPWELTGDVGDLAGDAQVFGNIDAPHVIGCSVSAHEQPLVSVVVPAYNPDAGLVNTVESLIRQSWQRLEILVIDDASTSGREHFDAVSSLDERVRIIRLTENSGAYTARNAGFSAAAGEFVTVLDADDLSHSRRIELQVAPLLAHPEAVATGIAGIRMFGNGELTMFGFYTARRNYSAFLFRRAEVIAALGRFDDVRKSGDVEFLGRLLARFGDQAVIRVRKHLSIVQLTAGSLSRNDIRYVWLAGDRVAYLQQYRGWHRQLEADQDRDAFVRASVSERSFVAPAAYLGQGSRDRFTYAVLQDWAEPVHGYERAALVARVPELEREPVGLLNGIHPRLSGAGRDAVKRSTWQWVESGSAEWLSWAREVDIDRLIVADPAYLLALPDASHVGARVAAVSILVPPSMAATGAPEAALRRDEITAICVRHFGVTPEWNEQESGT